MTTHNAPTTAPPTDPRTPAPRARAEQQPPDLRRTSGWLVWIGIAAALAGGIWLALAGVTNQQEAARTARINEAATARLQGQADQYETARTARINEAATARLQGQADQYEARANEGVDARLQGLATQFEAARIARVNEAATARLQGQADQYLRSAGELDEGSDR